MNNPHELTQKQWQLLSAYLDNQLSEKEKRLAEKMLQTNPAFKSALESLMRVHDVLKWLPEHKVPKNFTIHAPQTEHIRIPGWQKILRYSTALTALLLSFALALDFLPALGPISTRMSLGEEQAAEISAPKTAEFADEASALEEEPQIIFWGGSPAMGAYGKGGGGAEGMGSAVPPAYGIGGGIDTVETPSDMEISEEESLLEKLPAVDEQQSMEEMQMIPEAELAPAPAETMPESPDERLSEPGMEVPTEGIYLQESNPILGIRPPEEQGIIIEEITIKELPSRIIERDYSFRTYQIILAALLAVLIIPAWIIKRRR